MGTAIVLTLIAVFFRLLAPELGTWNFVPMGAVALYAGARLPRRWAWIVPVAAMALSDLVLDHGTRRSFFELTRWTIYATFGLTTLCGLLAKGPKTRIWLLPILSLAASMFFFVTSNLAVWAEGHLYPLTPSGLVACYVAALPFLERTVLADLLGTCLLFGLGPVVERVAGRLTRPRLAQASRD